MLFIGISMNERAEQRLVRLVPLYALDYVKCRTICGCSTRNHNHKMKRTKEKLHEQRKLCHSTIRNYLLRKTNNETKALNLLSKNIHSSKFIHNKNH